MKLRGIRGAITVELDSKERIIAATERLLRAMVEANRFEPEEIASALFTVTPDLHSEFPAAAARKMGWTYVPMLNFTEIGVESGLARCIRVMVHVHTEVAQRDIVHVYLEGAEVLRPDLLKRTEPPGALAES